MNGAEDFVHYGRFPMLSIESICFLQPPAEGERMGVRFVGIWALDAPIVRCVIPNRATLPQERENRPPPRDTVARLRGIRRAEFHEALTWAALLGAAQRFALRSVPSRVHSLAEFRRGEAQRLGELGDVLDAGIAQAAFNAADVGGVQPGAFGEFLLRELSGLALAADVQSEGGEDSIAFRHDS